MGDGWRGVTVDTYYIKQESSKLLQFAKSGRNLDKEDLLSQLSIV
jgi:hypothetical protein